MAEFRVIVMLTTVVEKRVVAVIMMWMRQSILDILVIIAVAVTLTLNERVEHLR